MKATRHKLSLAPTWPVFPANGRVSNTYCKWIIKWTFYLNIFVNRILSEIRACLKSFNIASVAALVFRLVARDIKLYLVHSWDFISDEIAHISSDITFKKYLHDLNWMLRCYAATRLRNESVLSESIEQSKRISIWWNAVIVTWLFM